VAARRQKEITTKIMKGTKSLLPQDGLRGYKNRSRIYPQIHADEHRWEKNGEFSKTRSVLERLTLFRISA
jgi:hypothetical protein